MTAKLLLKKILPPRAITAVRRSRTFLNAKRDRAVYYRPDYNARGRLVGGNNESRDYGAWYVVTDKLTPSSVVYSFGVGTDISFDLELIRSVGCTVHAFDPTPHSLAWLRSQQLPSQLVIHPYGVAKENGTIGFYAPKTGGSHSLSPELVQANTGPAIHLPVKRLAMILSELEHSRIHLLKMDIEGAEYDVIADLLNCGIVCDQLLVEFHHRAGPAARKRTHDAISQLKSAGFALAHMAAAGEEFTFVRR